MPDKKDKSYVGVDLVIDEKTKEFWLFKGDGTSEVIEGKAEGTFDTKDKIFTGTLIVTELPYTALKPNQEKIDAILTSEMPVVQSDLPTDKTEEPTTKVEEPVTKTNESVDYTDEQLDEQAKKFKFDVFKIKTERHLKTPPASLSRKLKKKWLSEYKRYWDAMGKPTPYETKEAAKKAALDEQKRLKEAAKANKATDTPPIEEKVVTEPQPAVTKPIIEPTPEAKDPLVEKVQAASGAVKTESAAVVTDQVKEERQKKVLTNSPYGVGNKVCKLKDALDGYIISHVQSNKDKKVQYAPLGAPVVKGEKRLFYVFNKNTTAAYMMTKLEESKAYAEVIKGCAIYPVTNISEEDWDLDIILVNNVVSLLMDLNEG